MRNIKNISILERPYEKLKMYGEESLSDCELLSIIINTGTKLKSSLEIAQELNGLTNLFELSLEELEKIHGIGEAKAIRLKAVCEISKRLSKPRTNKIKITSREDVNNFFGKEMSFLKAEALKLILLNNQNYVIKVKTIAVGSESNIALSIKSILSEVVKAQAPKIILIHNHPSGISEPSMQDINFTKRIVEAAKLLDIIVLDHIVIGNNNFTGIQI